MTPLGFKRKDLNQTEPCSPSSEKDWENEVVEPEVYVEGAQAEAMGAEELKAGETFTAPFEVSVKELTKIEENGKVRYRMRLCLKAMGDIESTDTGESNDEDESGGDDSDTSVLKAAMEMGE